MTSVSSPSIRYIGFLIARSRPFPNGSSTFTISSRFLHTPGRKLFRYPSAVFHANSPFGLLPFHAHNVFWARPDGYWFITIASTINLNLISSPTFPSRPTFASMRYENRHRTTTVLRVESSVRLPADRNPKLVHKFSPESDTMTSSELDETWASLSSIPAGLFYGSLKHVESIVVYVLINWEESKFLP